MSEEFDDVLIESIRSEIAEKTAAVSAALPKRNRWKEAMESLQAEAEDAEMEWEEYDSIVRFGLEEIEERKAEARGEYLAFGMEVPAEFAATPNRAREAQDERDA